MKERSYYICNSCGAKTAKWSGQCSNCGEWNTIVEEIEKRVGTTTISKVHYDKPLTLDEIESDAEPRIIVGNNELDRVLGGGIVRGSIILIGGDPGIGKSTLMLQMTGSDKIKTALYISGEESLNQVKLRASRLDGNFSDLLLLAETDIEKIYQTIKNIDCQIVIVDSIQSVFHKKIESAPGSVSQIRECANLLLQAAKTFNKAIFIIGHVNKDGFIAGPKVLEHIVDTVIQFEGDRNYTFRILRALKNRFGPANEIGIFEMRENGLVEVANPSEMFLSQRYSDEPGISTVCVMEGSRPILVEVQALVTPTSYGVPQRTVNGFDTKRLQMILAVLERRIGVNFGKYDVFVNIAGGLYVSDPGLDLGIAVSLISSYRDQSVNNETVLLGEIGLTGEIRNISQIAARTKEISKLGFKTAILPKNKELKKEGKLSVFEAEKLTEVLNFVFN